MLKKVMLIAHITLVGVAFPALSLSKAFTHFRALAEASCAAKLESGG